MQQPIENRRVERLVPREKLGPVADRFVRRDQDRAAAVAIGHQAKEQARFLARHRLEAELVDNQQGSVEVLAPTQSRRRQVCIALERELELVEAVELCREAMLDGFHSQADGEVRFPDPGGPWMSTVSAARM